MYSNFSALKTNMAIYLSPFQRHLTFSTSRLRYYKYIRGSEYSSGKKKKPGKVNVVPTFLHSCASKALSLALAAGRKITTVFLVPGLEE